MKYTFPLIAGICALIACNRIDPTESTEEMVLFASSPSVPELKSSFHGENALTWSRGDKMTIFDGTAAREFITFSDGASVPFYGNVSKSWTSLTGVYPHSSDNSLTSDGNVRASIPACQTASQDGFTDGANLAIGTTTSASGLILKNAGAYIKLAFTSSADISAIYIAANQNTVKLSGQMNFVPSSAELLSTVSGHPSVTLLPSNTTITPGTYYAVAAPVELPGGLRVIFRKTNGALVSKSGSGSVTLKRNETLDLGAINVDELPATSEPALENTTLSLNFQTAGAAFTESLPNSLQTGTKSYFTKEGGYEVTFSVKYLASGGNTRYQGWKFTSNYISLYANTYLSSSSHYDLDGIILPGIEGKRLVKVEIIVPNSNTFPMNITNIDMSDTYYDDDYPAMPSDKYNSSQNWLPGSHLFTMTESNPGERYRIIARKANSFCYIQSINLTYESVVL